MYFSKYLAYQRLAKLLPICKLCVEKLCPYRDLNAGLPHCSRACYPLHHRDISMLLYLYSSCTRLVLRLYYLSILGLFIPLFAHTYFTGISLPSLLGGRLPTLGACFTGGYFRLVFFAGRFLGYTLAVSVSLRDYRRVVICGLLYGLICACVLAGTCSSLAGLSLFMIHTDRVLFYYILTFCEEGCVSRYLSLGCGPFFRRSVG